MHGLGVNPISGQIAGRRVGRKIRKGLKRKRKEEKDEEEGRSGLTKDSGLVPNTNVEWFTTSSDFSSRGSGYSFLTCIDTPTHVA